VALKITYHESGGYAGLFRGAKLDADQLPAAEARKLRQLVEKAGLAKVASARSEGIPDLVLHNLEVETDAGKFKLSFDDITLPDSIRPLIEFLAKRSKPMPLA